MYLDELLHHDGRAGESSCSHCGDSNGLYKCKECFGGRLCCQACIVEKHSSHPLHRIEVCAYYMCIEALISLYSKHWNGSFFARTSLRDLGLTVYLGHQGEPCPFPGPVLDGFTVVHTNGIHAVRIQLCSCHGIHMLVKFQLLRCSWLPATTEDPQTTFTFDILDFYLLVSLRGKVSWEDFYISISRQTDNTGLNPPKVRNSITSEYAVLLTLRRIGTQNFFVLSGYGNI
jgi:CxC2 like cysteine cluster associated with KDZ transposases